MNVYPSGLPRPLVDSCAMGAGVGLRRLEMSGGLTRSWRVHAELPQTFDVTWRLSRAERAELVAFFDEIGVEEFYVPLRVPGDPRPTRSVKARLASDLAITLVGPSHDDVAATLTVDAVEIVLSYGALLAPDGSPAVASDGAAAQWEVLA